MKDYEVGRGRPPKDSQFKQGQSGNPKGRPKRTRNLKTELMDVLRETVTIREGGRTRKVTKLRALLESSLAKPFKGDSRAAVNLLSLIVRLVDPNRSLNPEPVNLNCGPNGEVEKELTPAEKWQWLRQLNEAFKDVKLPPAVRSAIFGDDDGEEGNGGNNAI